LWFKYNIYSVDMTSSYISGASGARREGYVITEEKIGAPVTTTTAYTGPTTYTGGQTVTYTTGVPTTTSYVTGGNTYTTGNTYSANSTYGGSVGYVTGGGTTYVTQTQTPVYGTTTTTAAVATTGHKVVAEEIPVESRIEYIPFERKYVEYDRV
jgi:hypothetical protein